MKKLFKLKEWLTIEETARRLTESLNEDFLVHDCLQLALDGHITASMMFKTSKYGVKIEVNKKTMTLIVFQETEMFLN